VIPLLFLVLNYRVLDQSRNYTAYEHALNIFRTADPGAVLFVEGDNHLFPVTYARLVERMRQDVRVYDRVNLLFKMPYLGSRDEVFSGTWESLRSLLEKEIITERKTRTVLYAVFNPFALNVPEHTLLVPYGLLHRVMEREGPGAVYKVPNLWRSYSSESFFQNFKRDFMTRQVSAHFLLRYGMHLYRTGNVESGVESIRQASQLANDDAVIQCGAALFFSDHGSFDLAREHLLKARENGRDVAAIQNNWGYFYYRKGDYDRAVEAFKDAVERSPENVMYRKNLALAIARAGEEEEAAQIIQKSVELPANQRSSISDSAPTVQEK